MNWKDSHLPCFSDSVSFAKWPEFEILLDRSLSTFGSVINFNYDANLIFDSGLSIDFETQTDAKCLNKKAGEAKFEVWTKGYWWDPDSWKCQEGDEGKYGCNSAVPDLHRIPCTSDSVLFPDFNQSLFYVIFSGPKPTIASLMIGTKSYTTSQFHELRMSVEGKKRIWITSPSRVTSLAAVYVEDEGPCLDATGCLCHPFSDIDKICSHKQHSCPTVSCDSPISMTGFCCHVCGGEVIITHNGSLSHFVVENLLKRVLENYEEADGFAAKMPDNNHHVYFVPKFDSSDYEKPLNVFLELFGKELNSKGIHKVATRKAEGTVAQKIASDLNKNSQATKAFFIFFFVALIIGFGIFIYKRKKMIDIPFSFRRLSIARLSTRSNRTVDIPSSSHIVSFSSADGRSFVNPTFNISAASRSDERFPTCDSPDLPERECPTQRENPLYAARIEEGISFNALKQEISSKESANRALLEENKMMEIAESCEESMTSDLQETQMDNDTKKDNILEIVDTVLLPDVSKDDSQLKIVDTVQPDVSKEDKLMKIMDTKSKPDDVEYENLITIDDTARPDFETNEQDEEDPLESLAKSRVEESKKEVNVEDLRLDDLKDRDKKSQGTN